MKFKNLGALFLLSLASIYFICPVQCVAIPEAAGHTGSDKDWSHHQHRIDSQTADETKPATCCESGNEASAPHENRGAGEGHCCLNQWDSLGSSEPQLASHIQKDTVSLVVLISSTPQISSDSVFFTAYLQFPHKPHTDPPIPQLSPRAPPFFLA